MRVSVSGIPDELKRDCLVIKAATPRAGAEIVRRNVTEGRLAAQRIARGKSGPHGSAYFKRITDEMTGPMTGVYGPHAGGTPVGAGWRHGPPNTDLENSLDLIRPKFHRDVDHMLNSLFWPGA